MSAGGLKLSVYLGEGDRDAGSGRPLCDALMDLLAGHRVLASALLRGVEGFGIEHRRRTDRLLTLSEDLPLVAVAVDTAERIATIVPEVAALVRGGLVTLERLALPDQGLGGELPPGEADDDAAKLTIYCGRGERAAGAPVPWRALRLLRAAGIPGATILTGLDGTIMGGRRRARFVSRNAGVPALVLSVGPRERYADVLPRLRRALPGRYVMTVERVHVVRQDGRVVGDLPALPAADAQGLALWQRVSVFAGEHERWEGRPLHAALLRRLRHEGAAGGTVLRGVAGYSGTGPVHADRVLALRRRTPLVLTVIDTVPEVARLWPLIARATAGTGLVTCELVPAFRALGRRGPYGGLALADPGALA